MKQGSPRRRRFSLPRLRHHRHRERLKGFGYFRRIGPGLVTGAADDDPSGIGTYSQVGAAFRFDLLWTAWVALPLAAAVQETAARLGLSSGKGLAALIKERFSRPVLIGAVTLVAAANTFNIGADIGSMAASIRLLAPIPFELLVVVIAATLVAVEVFLPYHRYAKVLRWLTLSLGFYIAVLLVVTVDWSVVARRTFAPHLAGDRAFLAALIAVFGTTISPYLFFWQASEEVEEEIEHHETPRLAAKHIRAMRADVIAGMASAVGIMFAIMVASAATLGAKGVTSIQTADQAAQALRPIAGSFASVVFTLGIVGTGALAVPVLAGSTGYALAEAFGWREGLSQRFSAAPGFYGAIVAATAVGVTMGFAGVNPIRSLYWAAILNGIAAPPLILLMLILSNSHRVEDRITGGVLSDILVGIACLVMTALPIAYLVS
jgi:NRAMP (natural resistance-associated macrophage protein)-like metal ion transporter